MADDQIQQDEPKDAPTLPSELVVTEDKPVICPRCLQATDSLQCCEVPNVVCLVVYIAWNYDRVVACPSCFRSSILKRCFIAIPLTNILFPLCAIVYLFQFLASFGKGHTDPAIADTQRMSRADRAAILPEILAQKKPARKEWLILGIVLFLCASVWIVGLALKPAQPPPEFEGRIVDDWVHDLRSEDVKIRTKAVDALGKIGRKSDKAVPALLKVVAKPDEDATVRYNAYWALTAIDPAITHDIPEPPLPNFHQLLRPQRNH